MRDLLVAMVKAHEIQGVLALDNSFNRVGLDHVLLVRVASTAVATAMLGGTREQVIDHLRRVEAAGISEVICYFNFGLLPHAATLGQMRRFAAEVMPAFQSEPALAT